jgi:hypothetical protein
VSNRPYCWPVVTLVLVAAFGVILCACNRGRLGDAIPEKAFQFPTGIAVHQDGFALVASSNIDLTYQSGSLRVIDLNQLADRLKNNNYNNPKEYDDVTKLNKYYSDLIIDDSAPALDNFAGRMTISEDNKLAALTIRETNQLVLVDLNVNTSGSSPVLEMNCFDTQRKANETFPFCRGDRHVVTLDNTALQFDPFDVVLLGETAYVSFLRSGTISRVTIPPVTATPNKPVLELGPATGEVGINDLAYSSKNNNIYMSSLGALTTSITNNVLYFDITSSDTAAFGTKKLYPILLGSETRGLAFNDDGSELAVIVLNPTMLVFLDTLNNNAYIGSIALGPNPSLVLQHNKIFFVTCPREDTVYIIDGTTKRLVQVRTDICKGPFDIGFFDRASDNLHWALFTCFEDHKVAVVDVGDPLSERYLTVIAKVGQADTAADKE